jgi:DNA sulfur modification protein DndC
MTTTQQPENKNQPNRTVPELVEYIQALTTEIQELYCLDEIPWVVGYSGGKDSTAILQLVWNAIAQLPPEKRTKLIHVITTDTGVENPYVSAWVRISHKHIELAAKEQKMPMKPHVLEPEIADTYWVGLIGKGYPKYFRVSTFQTLGLILLTEYLKRLFRYPKFRTCRALLLYVGLRYP